MSTATDSAVHYSTIEEVTTLFSLPPDKAALLLVKSNAAIDHGKSEPEGVAEKEDMALWVQQGLDKMESLDGIIRRFRDYKVVPSADVHGVRSSIAAMEAHLEREEEEEKRKAEQKAEDERRELETRRQQSTTTGGSGDRATSAQRKTGEETGVDRGKDVEELHDRIDRETSSVQARKRPRSPIEIPDSPTTSRPARKDKGKGRPLGTGPVPRLRATMSVISYPRQIRGREHEVCTRCTEVKARSGEPCGGPVMHSATRTACARCVQSHKLCSFREIHSAASGRPRRKRRDDDENKEGEEESTRGNSRSMDGDESDGVIIRRPKRRRTSKRTERSAERLAEKEQEEEDCALGAAMKEAYEALGRANEQLLLVQLRANRALSRTGGAGLFKM